MPEAVVSTIGHDRPGLVNELSALVHANGLNITDSRMTVLGGEFAVLMCVSGGETALDAFATELEQLAHAQALAHVFRKTTRRDVGDALPCQVRVVAMDHPGIVWRGAGFFSDRGVNIRDLETRTVRAPHTGTSIFDLNMLVEVPAEFSVAELRDTFDAFCRTEDLDGDLRTSTPTNQSP